MGTQRAIEYEEAKRAELAGLRLDEESMAASRRHGGTGKQSLARSRAGSFAASERRHNRSFNY